MSIDLTSTWLASGNISSAVLSITGVEVTFSAVISLPIIFYSFNSRSAIEIGYGKNGLCYYEDYFLEFFYETTMVSAP